MAIANKKKQGKNLIKWEKIFLKKKNTANVREVLFQPT